MEGISAKNNTQKTSVPRGFLGEEGVKTRWHLERFKERDARLIGKRIATLLPWGENREAGLREDGLGVEEKQTQGAYHKQPKKEPKNR